jgi:hypothetical protein
MFGIRHSAFGVRRSAFGVRRSQAESLRYPLRVFSPSSINFQNSLA